MMPNLDISFFIKRTIKINVVVGLPTIYFTSYGSTKPANIKIKGGLNNNWYIHIGKKDS